MAIRLEPAFKSAGIVFFISIFPSVKTPGATIIADSLVAGVPKGGNFVPKR
jgi:hypothetical protein